EVLQHDRLDQQRAHGLAVARRVGEGDGILDQAAEQVPREALVDRSEGGTDLPRPLAGDAGRRGGKDEHRADSHQQTALLARPRDDAQVEQLHVAECGLCGTASAGRHRGEGDHGAPPASAPWGESPCLLEESLDSTHGGTQSPSMGPGVTRSLWIWVYLRDLRALEADL